jgi:hypothetical protein
MQLVLLLVAHVILLILASTSFTAITALRDGHFQWDYFRFASQSGWGTPYQFVYTLPTVLTYLAAYGTGLAAYVVAWRRGAPIIGATGAVLCAIGLASFAFELTHWFTDHNRSLIISTPALLLALAVAAMVQQYRLRTRPAGQD